MSLLVFVSYDLVDFNKFFEDIVGEDWKEEIDEKDGKEGREEGSGDDGEIGDGGNIRGRGEGSNKDETGEYSFELWRIFFLLYDGSVFDNWDIFILFGCLCRLLLPTLLLLFSLSLLFLFLSSFLFSTIEVVGI